MKEKTALIILVTISAFAIISVAVLSALNVQLAPVYSLVLAATLIAITTLYVYWTSQTVKAANRQAEIMLNAEYNAAAPVVKLEVEGRGQIKVTCENIGKGPALNLRCWVEDKEHPELREDKVFSTAVAAGEPYVSFISADIDTGIKDYMLRVGCVMAQYESIFKKTYESSLLLSTDADPQLTYREVEGNSTAESSPSGAPEGDETQLDRIEKGVKKASLVSVRFTLLAIGFAVLIGSMSGLPIAWPTRAVLAGASIILMVMASRLK